MYLFILGLHNGVRWFALGLGVLAAVFAWVGWVRRNDWGNKDRRIGSMFAVFMDLQLLIGLFLLWLSPLTRTAFQDYSNSMGVAGLRFFALEHPVFMMLGVVFAHLGSILPRKADTSRAKFWRAAIWFSLALLMILLGMPWDRPLFPGAL